MTVFDYKTESGTLTEKQTISTVPSDFKGTSHCADLKITPNGRFLYGTNRGHDSIAAFAVDAKTGEDITHQVLTQIIVDEEARGTTMLPINFLRQLIGMYGGKTQGMVPPFLEAAMDAFQKQQSAVAGALGTGSRARSARELKGCGHPTPSGPGPRWTPRW